MKVVYRYHPEDHKVEVSNATTNDTRTEHGNLTTHGNQIGKVNWDGEIVKNNHPWYDEELFSMGEFSFTVEESIGFSAVIILAAACVSGFCIVQAYRKRQAVIEVSRRLSEGVRASFRRKKVGDSVAF